MLGMLRRRGAVAGESPYWNPKTETLSRERLERLQVEKLRRQCEWAATRSPWYRKRFVEAGIDPASVRSLRDLRRLPVLTREDWMESQFKYPPYGEIPTIPPDGAVPCTRPPAPPAAGRCERWIRARTGRGSPRCGATRSGAAACAPRTPRTSRSATARSSASGGCTTRWRRSGY